MPLPQDRKHLAPTEHAALIHAVECDIAEASAWARQPMTASDRVKIRAKITEQEKWVWRARHGH